MTRDTKMLFEFEHIIHTRLSSILFGGKFSTIKAQIEKHVGVNTQNGGHHLKSICAPLSMYNGNNLSFFHRTFTMF